MPPAMFSVTAAFRTPPGFGFGRLSKSRLSRFAPLLRLSSPVADPKETLQQVPNRANIEPPTMRLFDTGTNSRYFHFMALRSPGCPYRFARFSFLFCETLFAPPFNDQRNGSSRRRHLTYSRQQSLWKLWSIRPPTPMPRSISN
jgi:hypothetical protein